MASTAPPPLRQALEQRLSQLSLEMEGMFSEARERARRELADQLNQAARRIAQAPGAREIGATLLDAVADFVDGCAFFRVEVGVAKGDSVRGIPGAAAERFANLEIPLVAAAALAGAVEGRDTVVAEATPNEVSQVLVDLAGHSGDERVSIFPLIVRGRVGALLYGWGKVDIPVVELLAQVAAGTWSALAAAALPGLVEIATAAAAAPPPVPGSAWDRLPLGEQQIHLRAQRFARVQVADIRLREPEAVRAGRERKNLYEALEKQIEAAREKFRQAFFVGCPSMVDYLHLELIRTLANDDAELLGKDYPGPMV
jgi:hypothetical protein